MCPDEAHQRMCLCPTMRWPPPQAGRQAGSGKQCWRVWAALKHICWHVHMRSRILLGICQPSALFSLPVGRHEQRHEDQPHSSCAAAWRWLGPSMAAPAALMDSWRARSAAASAYLTACGTEMDLHAARHMSCKYGWLEFADSTSSSRHGMAWASCSCLPCHGGCRLTCCMLGRGAPPRRAAVGASQG